MAKLSKLLGVTLLLLAPAMLSATPVPVGTLTFVHELGGDQYFQLTNNTSSGDIGTALNFTDLKLVVTYGDGEAPDTVTANPLGPGIYSGSGISTDWLFAPEHLITSATLTGKIDPKAFQYAGVTFYSTGDLSASLDLSGHTGPDIFFDPADITVTDAPAPTPVPEPSTLVLLAGPAVAFVVRRVRR